jgi:hypothetical protein
MALRLDASQRPTELVVEPESSQLRFESVRSPRLVLRRDPSTLYVTGTRQ